MVLIAIDGDHPLGDSQVETNFILSTIHGGVVRSLDVHLETLKKHSLFFRGIPPDEKSMKVDCPLEILRLINGFYMTGMCRFSEDSLESVSYWCEKLKFHALHKKVQKFISPLQEVKVASSVAEYVISSDEDESQMTTESDAVNGSSPNAFKREANDEQTYIVHKSMKGNSEEKPATLANEVGAQRQAEAFGSTAHTADSYLVSNEIGASSTIEECIDLTSDEEESERAMESDGFNESSQNTFEANRNNGKADNIAQILNENGDPKPPKLTRILAAHNRCTRISDTAECEINTDCQNESRDAVGEFDRPPPPLRMFMAHNSSFNTTEAKATASNGQSENDKGCQSEPRLPRYATRSTTLKAKHADMEESDSSEEDTAFNSESSRNSWSNLSGPRSEDELFLKVWLKSVTHPRINMREELVKNGIYVKSYALQKRMSSFEGKYVAHINGIEQPDIKPYLSLIKDILDAKKSYGDRMNGRAFMWTKEMVDVLLDVWTEYAKVGLLHGTKTHLAKEIVQKLARLKFPVNHMQVLTKMKSMLKVYTEHKHGNYSSSILPYVPRLDQIHRLMKR